MLHCKLQLYAKVNRPWPGLRISAKNQLHLDDLLFNIRLGSAKLLYCFGNMLKKSSDFTYKSKVSGTRNKHSERRMLTAVSPRPWSRWPRHPRADQEHTKKLRWGRRCVTWTDGATHLHIWLPAPRALLMATGRTASGVQPARQRGAPNPNDFKWQERPVRLHCQKQHNRGHIWAAGRLGNRWWVIVDADLLWPIMMTVGFGLHPCIRLPDRRKTERILWDWSLENVVKVIQWLSPTHSPPNVFLSVLAMRLSFFTSGLCVLLSSVWTPDPLSLLILPLWCLFFFLSISGTCLDGGEVAGIVIGCFLLIILVLILFIFLWRRTSRRRRRRGMSALQFFVFWSILFFFFK